ncbi:hypothetical protein DFP92_10556 [Yoonia sediminilitoris]|uniref:Uncharacterized protein n=2 Tax=Yoonia sediminilitoris TaxID=1286148 RepID=A0A2T6KH73_9RHOB|nr:hypothetical protein C8N45_10556 [Yoonia sediminilitoris]RCW95552.1 hypothetical protein DFP92_10556 [Yoonia sediminilitoris]
MTLLVLVLGLLAYCAVAAVGQNYQSYREASKQTLAINGLADGLLQARTAAFAYRDVPTDAAKDVGNSRFAALRRAAENYRDTQSDAAGIAVADRIVQLAAAYGHDFQTISEARADAALAHDALSHLSEDTRASLTALGQLAAGNGSVSVLRRQSQATEALLLAHMHVDAYFSAADEAQYQAAASAFQSAATSLTMAKSGLARGGIYGWENEAIALVDTAFAEIDALQGAAADMRGALLQYVTLRDRSRIWTAAQMRDIPDNPAHDIVDQQNELGLRGRALARQMLFAIPALGVVALLLSGAISIAVGRWIKRPLHGGATAPTAGQATPLEQTVAALEDLTASVKLSAERAKMGANTINTIDAGEDSLKMITKITEAMSDISRQTNLLVLNAGGGAAGTGSVASKIAPVKSTLGTLPKPPKPAPQLPLLVLRKKVFARHEAWADF